MNLNLFMKNYAHQVGGQYTGYDEHHSIIVVPLPGHRFQTVLGTLKRNKLYNRELISFSSKICPYKPDTKLDYLLKQVPFFNYARLILDEGFLKIEAIATINTSTERVMIEKIEEVANLADQYEMKLLGSDTY